MAAGVHDDDRRTAAAINTAVVARVLATLGVRMTIDVDGVVVSTGLQVERGLPRVQPASPEGAELLPIMAHLAELLTCCA